MSGEEHLGSYGTLPLILPVKRPPGRRFLIAGLIPADNCHDRAANPHLFHPDATNWPFLNNVSTYDYFENISNM